MKLMTGILLIAEAKRDGVLMELKQMKVSETNYGINLLVLFLLKALQIQ